MKNKSTFSNDGRFYEQLRQQIGVIPWIESSPVTSAAEQTGMNRACYAVTPAIMHAERELRPLVIVAGDESVLMQTVKGIVRSFVFFNWKDHA